MTTPAQEAGFVIGQQYVVKDDEADHHALNPGDVVRFTEDDSTRTPYFTRISDGLLVASYITRFKPMEGAVTDNTDLSYNIDVSSTGTVVKTSRKLSLDQIKAIMEIIGG